VEEQEREPQEVIAVMVTDDYGLELVGIEAELIQGWHRAWRSLEEEPAVHKEAVVAGSARCKSVAGPDKREVHVRHEPPI
jgi:hypothetical protein